MTIPGGQVVHIWLEVFDYTILICRCEVCTGVRELHRSDGRVVGLENGFKVECETVP